jgi:hypothetical protein
LALFRLKNHLLLFYIPAVVNINSAPLRLKALGKTIKTEAACLCEWQCSFSQASLGDKGDARVER